MAKIKQIVSEGEKIKMSTELYILRLKIENLENRARNAATDSEFEANCEKIIECKKQFDSLARKEFEECCNMAAKDFMKE